MAKEKTFAEFTRMARAGLTDEQILTSGAMSAMFTNIAAFVTGRYERRCTVKVKYSSSGSDTAATDGDVITVDTNTSLLKGLGLIEKLKGLIGLVYHECGHILFTDFRRCMRCMEAMQKGDALLPEPTGINEDIDEAYATYQRLAGKMNKSVLIRLWQTVQNCVEDGAIENFLRTLFPGYAGCLNTLRGIMFEQDPEINTIPEKSSACICLILQLATCHKMKGSLVSEEYDLTTFFDKTSPIISEAIQERDSRKRIRLINGVYVILVHELFKDLNPEDMKGGDGGDGDPSEGSDGDSSKGSESSGSSSSGASSKKTGKSSKSGASSKKKGSSKASGSCGDGGSDEGTSSSDMGDLIRSLEEAMGKAADQKSASSTKGASGRRSESVDIKHAEEFGDEAASSDKKPTKGGDETLEDELESIKADVIKEEAEKLAESELKKEFSRESGYRDDVPLKVIRPTIPEDAEARYQELKHELGPAIKTASRMLAREIEDRKLGEIQHGKIYGRALDQNYLSRLVGGKMMSKRLPEDKPDMAVMCLVDESGSMASGTRIPSAINAAFIVNGFCDELSLPLSIYGHSERFRGDCAVEMRSYREFGFDGDRKAAKRLLGIDARQDNRDGFAVRFCTERLKKRDEHIKLFLIVSDGQPAANAYCGKPAIEDTRRAVAEARKAGAIVVAAGIGSDSANIRDVYASDSMKPSERAIFLDVSNPQDLAKELVKILKRTARMAI